MWLAAWKLVSNNAKRTVAPPNAKHSTLLQGCFLCFCFWSHSQSETMRNLSPGLFPLSRKNQRKCLSIFAIVVMDYFFVVGVGFGHEAVERGMV